LDNDTESSEEDFKNDVRQRLDLIDERLQRLEEQMQTFLEAGAGDLKEPEGGSDPDSSP
jgi:GTPase